MSRRVLVVDDDRDILALVNAHLSHQGWEVRVSETASDMESLIVEFRPMVVLCDLCMPDRDAVEFLWARSGSECAELVRRTPIIVVTAHDLVEDAIGDEMDVAGIVRKPLNLAELTSVVEAVAMATVQQEDS